jgi:hypothetical protein
MNWPTAHQQQPTFATKSAMNRHADLEQGINKRSYEQPADERLNERLRGRAL